MANTFQLIIVTPERQVVLEEVEELTVPGTGGYVGVLPGHTPLLTTLKAGEVSFRMGTAHRYLATSRGVVEVLPEKVTLLVETAEAAEEIDVDRASTARQQAEKALSALLRTPLEDDSEFKQAEARLQRAVVRLQVARKGPAAPPAHS
ncbi:MAG: F0F1 ATP synthase subunit epsilon [Acidobacteriota bacterium]